MQFRAGITITTQSTSSKASLKPTTVSRDIFGQASLEHWDGREPIGNEGLESASTSLSQTAACAGTASQVCTLAPWMVRKSPAMPAREKL